MISPLCRCGDIETADHYTHLRQIHFTNFPECITSDQLLNGFPEETLNCRPCDSRKFP